MKQDKKIQKGQPGYLAYKKKTELIKTIILFAIPLALFFAGLISTGTRKNLLTLVAVLGFLPASKSAVLLIMYIKSHGIEKTDLETIESLLKETGDAVTRNLTALYDMVFTTQEHTFEVPAIILYGGSAFGFLHKGSKVRKSEENKPAAKRQEDERKLLTALEKHLETTLKKERLSVNVKIFSSSDELIGRLKELKEVQKADEVNNAAIRKVLCDISL